MRIALLAVLLLVTLSLAQSSDEIELEHHRGACCKPDGDCRFRSGILCHLSGGVFLGRGTNCDDNSTLCPGACCLTDRCDWVNENECDGVYRGNETTCDYDCDGACCTDDVCTRKKEFECGGTFHAIGTHCLPEGECPSLDGITLSALLFAVLFFLTALLLCAFSLQSNGGF